MNLFNKIFKSNKKETTNQEVVNLKIGLSVSSDLPDLSDEDRDKLEYWNNLPEVLKIAKAKDDKLYSLEIKAHESKNIDEEIKLRQKVIKYYTEYKNEFFEKGGYYKEYFTRMHMKCHNSRNPCFEAVEPHIERLNYIKENYDMLIVEEKQQKENNIKKQKLMKNFDSELKKALANNPNILQTDLYKMFDVLLKPEISEKLYYWNKSGVISREKSGRSYKIKLNN